MGADVDGVPPRGWFTAGVSGPSMVPALRHGDLLLVRAEREPAAYPVGSVALVCFTARPGLVMVKRVVAHRGKGLWVRGDNAAASDASDEYGTAMPLGRVVVRIWPRPRFLRAIKAKGDLA